MSIEQVIAGTRTWHVETTDVLQGLRAMPDGSVQCVVTSPPYWGLRDYGVAGQLGLEKTPREFVDVMVGVFEEVRRVLRHDGTLWLNIGDSYNAGTSTPRKPPKAGVTDVGRFNESGPGQRRTNDTSLKVKDLVGVPWLLAFALRDAGWYLRSEIIWHKRSPMPESVRDRPTKAHEQLFLLSKDEACLLDGEVDTHETLFLLSKSPRYFYDAVASAEPAVSTHGSGNGYKRDARLSYRDVSGARGSDEPYEPRESRNMRTVWSLSSEPFSEAHFATFPTELVRPCLLAGTSAEGSCSECGAPWRRVTERTKTFASGSGRSGNAIAGKNGDKLQGGGNTGDIRKGPTVEVETIGWEPTCDCGSTTKIPCLVLDPFNGAGTTGVVARRLGLRYVGLELNPDYAAMARRRIVDDQPLLNAS